VESKPADVFAFAMFAVEVFTGEIPFKNRRNEAVALSILQGNRPEMPRDSQTVGLTDEMRNLLRSCWQPDPTSRPTVEELVGRWQEFVGCSNGDSSIDNAVGRCVQIIRVPRSRLRFRPQLCVVNLGYHNLQRNAQRALLDLGRKLRPFNPEGNTRPFDPA